MRAAILGKFGGETLDVRDDIEAVGFGPGKVRVRMRAAGLCHSDLTAMSGALPYLAAPFVAGHEGAGEVVEVGDGVTGVAVGDHVIVCALPPCRSCPACRRGQANLCLAAVAHASVPHFRLGGETDVMGLMGTGTFAEEMVLNAAYAVPIPGDVPFDVAALIGCGVTTGIGAVLNTARVAAGSSVVVFGCGGVGISVIQGARVAGAAEIVAVDPLASRRERALAFGATDAAAPDGLEKLSARITGGEGFDYAFEAVGRSATTRAAYEAARRGGTVCVIGAGAGDDAVQFSMGELYWEEKRILPSLYGGGDVAAMYHRIIKLWHAGLVDLGNMITHRVGLAEINDAITQMQTGRALRTCILL
jgi:S-(hydroxymethyl)glutathione dehydrogenase / alcohol dehydrogenase